MSAGSAHKPTKTCIFFVHELNVWIDAPILATEGVANLPEVEGLTRPRLRVDTGSLIETIRKDRRQGDVFLYGPRPPPNDKVWALKRNHEIQTTVYDFCPNKSMEAAFMSADLSSVATELTVKAKYNPKEKQQKDNTVLVIIIEDLSQAPAILKALECGIDVEIWTWQTGASAPYSRVPGLWDIEPRPLDWAIKELSFTSVISAERREYAGADKTIVIDWLTPADEEEFSNDHQRLLQRYQKLINRIGDQFLRFGQRFQLSYKGKSEVALEFPDAENIQEVMITARKLVQAPLRVMSGTDYVICRMRYPAIKSVVEMYKPLELLSKDAVASILVDHPSADE